VSIDLEGARCEEEAARLLPWFVAGRLGAADAERVAKHLEHCAICRADLAHERSVRSLLKADARVEYAPQAGLAKTLARIDELGREPVAPERIAGRVRAWAPRRGVAVRWLTAAVVVQAVGLGVLGFSHLNRLSPDAAAEYATLSAGVPPVAIGSHIRAVFAPTMTLEELKAVLAARSLTIVRGPSDAGAYTLGSIDAQFDSRKLAPTVAALRADSRVLFVEPAINDEAPAR
jgi:anti-sigma factor RsiW